MEDKQETMSVDGSLDKDGSSDIHCDQLVEQMAHDYSNYMNIEVTKEKHQFEDHIEDLLMRLDEYCGLVDLIRSDTNLCLERTLPAIQAKGQEMEVIFEHIDQLEAFVSMVRKQVVATEEQLNQAEKEMGSFKSIKKVFNSISMPSFLSKKQKFPQSPGKAKYKQTEIFRTEDYLS